MNWRSVLREIHDWSLLMAREVANCLISLLALRIVISGSKFFFPEKTSYASLIEAVSHLGVVTVFIVNTIIAAWLYIRRRIRETPSE